jgi:hypothetical protein
MRKSLLRVASLLVAALLGSTTLAHAQVSGSLGTGDWNTAPYSGKWQDRFTVNLVAGVTYTFEMPVVTGYDSYLAICTSSLSVIAANDDSRDTTLGPNAYGYSARLPYTATQTGTFILIGTTFGTGSTIPNYTIQVRASNGQVPTLTQIMPAAPSPPTSVSGSLSSGDWNTVPYTNKWQDRFTVNLVAGVTYTFEMPVVTGNDSWLAICNSSLSVLAYNDDSGDTTLGPNSSGYSARLRYTATSTGTFILIGTTYGTGSTIASYTINATASSGSSPTMTQIFPPSTPPPPPPPPPPPGGGGGGIPNVRATPLDLESAIVSQELMIEACRNQVVMAAFDSRSKM